MKEDEADNNNKDTENHENTKRNSLKPSKKLNRWSIQIPKLNISAPESDNSSIEDIEFDNTDILHPGTAPTIRGLSSPRFIITDHKGESSDNYFSAKPSAIESDITVHNNNGLSAKKINWKRPALTLTIPSFSNPIKVISPNSSSGRSSPRFNKSQQQDGYLTSTSQNSRKNSFASIKDNTDSDSNISRVLTYIDNEELEEYEDIQREFRSAIDGNGFSWLPQLDNTGPKSSSPRELSPVSLHSPSDLEPSIQSNLELNIFTQPSANLESSKSPLHFSSATTDKKVYFNTDNNVDEQTLEITYEQVKDSLSEEVELPNFDDFFDKNEYNHLRLYGHSLAIFSETNLLRYRLAKLHVNPKYKLLYYMLLIIFTILLSYRTYNPTNYDFLYHFSSPIDTINFVLCILFSIHDVTQIIAFGFWDDSEMFRAHSRNYVSIVEWIGLDKFYTKMRNRYGAIVDVIIPVRLLSNINRYKKNIFSMRSSVTQTFESEPKLRKFDCPRAFARSSWNRNDLIANVSFWIGLLLSINNFDRRTGLNLFRTLAILRILRLLDTDTGISAVLRGLKVGIPQLLSVGSMLVYFWTFFGILGVQIFNNSLRRQCVWINPDDSLDTYQYDNQFCGGYLDPTTKEALNYVYYDGEVGPNSKGFLCPVNSKCISNANPFNGRVSFDNIVNSMELIFVIMSSNTFTDLMYYAMDADEMPASLFFIVSTIVLTIWMLNLLLAALVTSFEIADAQFREKMARKAKTIESLPLRLIDGYWKYFKYKAEKSNLAEWVQKCLFYYDKIKVIFIVAIAIDLVTRALPESDSSLSKLSTIFQIEKAITIILFIESVSILFLHSSNLWKFLTTPTLLIDFITSIVTLTVTLVQETYDIGQIYQWLSIFQISRSYRVIMYFDFLRKLWKRVLTNYIMIWDLTAFYFLFIYLASIIVSVYFEGYIPASEEDDTEYGMYGLPNSFISLFIIGSTENWTDILYNLQQHAPNISSAIFSSIILISWFIVSNFVILNIFIAIISRSFFVKENEKRYLQIRHYMKYLYPRKLQEYRHATLLRRIQRRLFKKEDDRPVDFKQFLIRGTAIMNIANDMENLMDDINHNIEEGLNLTDFKNWVLNLSFFKHFPFFTTNPFYFESKVKYIESNEKGYKHYMLEFDEYQSAKLDYLKQYPSFNYTYFIFPPNHRLRLFCQKIVAPSVGQRTDGVKFYEDTTDIYNKKSYFHNLQRDISVVIISLITVFLVVLSCFVTPLYEYSKKLSLHSWENVSEYFFLVIFTIEFFIKTIADGFVYTPNAYLRNPWNCIDFTVLISMWIDFIATIKKEDALAKGFKGLTALRALRCLTISNTARETFVIVIYDGIGKIFEASLVSLTLLYPYTIWGLNLFRGRLATCNDNDVDMLGCYNEYSSVVFKWDVLTPRVYENPNLYMDNFSSTFRSLYEVMSLEGWTDLLSNLMNSSGVGTIPSTFATPVNGTFMILFIFSSMVFILNLFVSFVINNHARIVGTAYQTSVEKSWLESKKILSQVTPNYYPDLINISKVRQIFFKLTVSKKNLAYSTVINITLYLHVIFLLSIHSSEKANTILFATRYFMFSTTILTSHELMYFLALGKRAYFKKGWPFVRLCITFLAFLFTLLLFHIPRENFWFRNITQIVQLLIFLFLIPQSDMLTELLQTGMASLPSLLSLLYTWGILFLVYAIALNQIFGTTKLGPNTTGNLNFRTVIKSLIVLFRCSFGEGWNYIMDDLTVEKPYCSAENGYSDCGSIPYAYILLISWNLISMYIFTNMVISLVVSNFSYVFRRENSISAINKHEIRKFIEAWSNFDSNGNGILGHHYLPKLMHSFDGPLSFTIWGGRLKIKSLVENYMEVNPNDPYDVTVDFEGLNKELNNIDKEKVILRKTQYRRFVQQAFHINAYEDYIRFSDLLMQIPLYTVYNPRECLGIDEYVQHLYVMSKVDKFLDNQKHFDVLNMVVDKWKYISSKKYGRKMHATNPFSNEYEVKKYNSLSKQDDNDLEVESIPLKTPAPEFADSNFNWSYSRSPERVNSTQFKRPLFARGDALESIERFDSIDDDPEKDSEIELQNVHKNTKHKK
ncbi:hypothetical protein TPHA_0A04960 [Tetrapisispora phaffii CBS 4417]|uniref:Calcium-channel protein CCH1 n=1 Tax=Tetrapisispora phaffii (strain ATCC 24235 / CBS 4417 / NBRC 1672 / NRRL Y-8282 / UCD 70-5) TaxID=1071381 RepID=G8BNU3_TETPH|nr:hypothetical protein TPHA_0A04960 [Tetrapisispora phaffii CBS 4417]CCE61571.1 hypothetical protein TPHA_0A04960 [Tetrapisispora phaffii CBS 4417]